MVFGAVSSAAFADADHRLQWVQFVLPLRAHANARPAALAYFAAVEQGKGDPMAAALLAAEERSPATCERLASTLGLDMAAYRACVADPTTDEKIEQRVAWLEEKDYPGLPVIWIENQGLLGTQTYASLRAAWQRAEGYRNGNRGPPGRRNRRGAKDAEARINVATQPGA